MDLLLDTPKPISLEGSMKKNIGTIDKVIRLLLVAVVVVLFMAHLISGIVALVAGGLAVVLLLTSLVGVCPLYMPFGISTIRK